MGVPNRRGNSDRATLTTFVTPVTGDWSNYKCVVCGPVRERCQDRVGGPRSGSLDSGSVSLDTVAAAALDPDREQPWAELGLKEDEYARIKEILGRRPTASELAMYSVMWSEHCSYKSSKVHLKQFSEIPQETPVGKMLAGIGENAGVIDIGQGYAVTFKVESHNHPSYVEPYQGAATGIGGIVRDIVAMGARPVAVMDPLRFGPLDAEDTHRVLPGIVAGVGGYGNCLGLPNIGGEAVFDATYLGNPLVNALCVGVLRHEDLHLALVDPSDRRLLAGFSPIAAASVAQFMPPGMQSAGTAMHRAASQFAIVAKDASVTGDLQGSLAALAKVSQTCVACHAAYRIQSIDPCAGRCHRAVTGGSSTARRRCRE